MSLKQKRQEAERKEIQTVLNKYGSMDECAQDLGISRMTLYRKMIRYGMGGFYENKGTNSPKENKVIKK